MRDLLGPSWSRPEQRLHRVIGRAIGLGTRLVPWRHRYHPRARAGWDRESGPIRSGAPIVHTPARNLPPLDRRGSPVRYSPEEVARHSR